MDGSIDLLRVMFLLGAVLALAYKRRVGVTPGGIIVPGTFAALLLSSVAVFLSAAATALACWLVYRSVFGRYALSRRWASLITIALSVVMGLVVMAVMHRSTASGGEREWLSLVAPGLVALSAHRYSLPKVLTGTAAVTAATCAAGWLLGLVVPDGVGSYLDTRLAGYTPLTLTHPYVVLPISLAVAIAVHHRFGSRAGGHLIAPFLAVVIVSSVVQALLLLVGVAASYAVVRAVQRHTFVIGLERFVLGLFCGYVVVTTMDLIAVTVDVSGYRPAPLVLIVAVAVLTSDLSLQPRRDALSRGISPSLAVAWLVRLVV